MSQVWDLYLKNTPCQWHRIWVLLLHKIRLMYMQGTTAAAINHVKKLSLSNQNSFVLKTHYFIPIKLFLFQPRIFLSFTLPILSRFPLGWGGWCDWESGCMVLNWWLWLNHHSFFYIHSLFYTSYIMPRFNTFQ